MEKHNIFDIDGRQIILGHIVAVRYVWNSYAGEVTMKGLYVGGRYHELTNTAHYQIIGHVDEDHKDYNKDIKDWLKDYYTGKYPSCPIKLRIYDNKV